MPTSSTRSAWASRVTVAVPQADDDLCVARVPVFQGLSRDQQLDVATVARPMHFDRDEIVHVAGSEVSQLLVVHSGRLRISRSSADGREHLVRILGPGDFVGESAFLTGARPDHTVTAVEPTSLCVFRHADLGRLVRSHPSIALRMLQTVSTRLEETESRLASATTVDVSARVADYLLGLTGRQVDGVVEVELPLPKKDIAALLDTTPESLSRQLRRLSDAGTIEQRGHRRVRLLDLDALTTLTPAL